MLIASLSLLDPACILLLMEILLLGCDTCLDLEVLEFMNLELITTPESKQPEQEMPRLF